MNEDEMVEIIDVCRAEKSVADEFIGATIEPDPDSETGGALLVLTIRHVNKDHAIQNAESFITAIADLMNQMLVDHMLGDAIEYNGEEE